MYEPYPLKPGYWRIDIHAVSDNTARGVGAVSEPALTARKHLRTFPGDCKEVISSTDIAPTRHWVEWTELSCYVPYGIEAPDRRSNRGDSATYQLSYQE